MELSNYPIILIASVIIIYLISKNKKNENAVVRPIVKFDNEFANETEVQFTERCHHFIYEWLSNHNIRFHVSSDMNSFNILFEDGNGLITNNFIESHFSNNGKIITLNARISQIIPDHKLGEVAELVNRLNEQLLVCSLFLNYEGRVIENKLVYYAGDSSLNDRTFDFYYGILASLKVNTLVSRLVIDNESPAIVALDW